MWIGCLTLQDLNDLIEVVLAEALAAALAPVGRADRCWCAEWWSGPPTVA
jgi:hypothetical protein